VTIGFGGVPAMLPSDAEMKSQSSVLNGSGVVNRPPPAPIGLPQQLRLQQQQMLQQRGVSLASFRFVLINVSVNMRFIVPPLLKEHGCIT